MNKKIYKFIIITIIVLIYIVHIKSNRNYLFNEDMLKQCSIFMSRDFWNCVEIIDLDDKEQILMYCGELKIQKSIVNPSYLIGEGKVGSNRNLVLKNHEERYDIRLPYPEVQLDMNYAYKEKPYVVVDVYENNPELFCHLRREYCTISQEGFEYLYEFAMTYPH